ncbi:response regulator [Pseudanabaena sp. FACHB-2040]|uniref:response regulator n=1 Tax=Pseudanabaena sp. FACHB-2040 TaxID=2692859 RepID=UPI001F54ECAF|nr:response regulator [Pseudanabaena sp. FACHB-2040]
MGAGLKADALSDLNSVIESLYLEDEEINATVQQLDNLAVFHQTLSHQGARYRQDLQKTEQQIFWLLGFRPKESVNQGTILIVDDSQLNVHLLSTALSKHGYTTCHVSGGRLALSEAESLEPDLILLDIMMPEMDGYEVCERLKANPATRDIPLLFVSTINLVLDKVKAFSLGGVDYITKPFQLEEVLARIDHQIKLRNLQKRLEEQNVRLQHEIKERKKAETQFRSLFENAVDGIFQTTVNGQYINANSALAQIYGYESPEVLIAAINNIAQHPYVEPLRREQLMAELRQHQVVREFESQIYRKDGSILWISETIRVVQEADGNLLYFEGTVRSLTK